MTGNDGRPGPAYLGGIALVSLSVLYFLFWAGVDVAARLGVWPDGWLGFTGEAFIASLTVLDETLFVLQGAAKFLTLYWLIKRDRRAVFTLAAVIILGTVQWILLLSNPVYDGGSDGYIALLVDLAAFGLLMQWRMSR